VRGTVLNNPDDAHNTPPPKQESGINPAGRRVCPAEVTAAPMEEHQHPHNNRVWYLQLLMLNERK